MLCDFGVSIRVNGRGVATVGNTGPGGNPAHLAPEILHSHNAQLARAVMRMQHDYSRQPVWALGVLCCEIVLGEHPFDSYPTGFEAFTERGGGRGGGEMAPCFCVAQGDIVARGMPREFATLVQRMVDHRARLRPSLNEVYACLLTMPLPPAAAVTAPTPSVSVVGATPPAAAAMARSEVHPPKQSAHR